METVHQQMSHKQNRQYMKMYVPVKQFDIQQKNIMINKIVCLKNKECLIVYNKQIDALNLVTSEIRKVFCVSNQLMDLSSQKVSIKPVMQGFCIKNQTMLTIINKNENVNEVLKQQYQLIITPSFSAHLLIKNQNHNELEIRNLKNSLFRSKIKNINQKLTGDSYFFVSQLSQNIYQVKAIQTLFNQTINLSRKYNFSVSLDNKIGLFLLEKDKIIIFEKCSKYQKTTLIYFINLRTRQQTLLSIFKQHQIYLYHSINKQNNLISFITTGNTIKTGQKFTYIVFNYKLNKVIFKQRQLRGKSQLNKYINFSYDLEHVVKINEDKPNTIQLKRLVQKRKLLFHIYMHSYLKKNYGEGIIYKVLIISEI